MTDIMSAYVEFIQSLMVIHGPIELKKRIIGNGTIQITAYDHNDKYIQHISQRLIPKDVLESMPIQEDFTTKNPPCIVCGRLGTELHHFAPQHLFEDADLWPKSYLCRSHHNEWHRRISDHYNVKIR